MVWLYTEYAKTHFLLFFLWASPNNGEVSVDNMGWVAMVLLLATSDYKLNTIDMVLHDIHLKAQNFYTPTHGWWTV